MAKNKTSGWGDSTVSTKYIYNRIGDALDAETEEQMAQQLSNLYRELAHNYKVDTGELIGQAKKITVKLDGFSEVLSFAESLGWVDTYGTASDGSWSPEDADACEGEALDFIESKGYEINFNDHD
mgnify:CR=1 FL=1